MKKHGPTADNKPNPWFAKQVAKRKKRKKAAKKSKKENR